MKKRSTKSALVMSVLSILLCVSMLIGTTAAWFTDSVSTVNNIITAGNLDVELYYKNVTNGATATDWTKVDAETNVFKTGTLWEPGHVEVIQLKVANEGTLALQYILGINIAKEIGSINVDNAAFKLSDYIFFAVIDGAQNYTRDEAVAAAMAHETNTQIKNGYFIDPEGELLKDGEDEVTVVVYMPESVGNAANYKKDAAVPVIELGIELVATQLTEEDDSYGDDYDTDSEYPVVSTVKIPAGTTDPTVIEANEVSVEVPAGADAGEYVLEVTNKQVKTDAGKTSVSFDIDLTVDGVKVEPDGSTKYAVSIEVGKNLDIVEVTHKGVALAHFFYDPTVGVVEFETESFSPFAVVYEEAGEDSVYLPEDKETADKLEDENNTIVAVDAEGNEYATFAQAIGSGASVLYFKEGVDLGEATHVDVKGDLLIYGNGAYLSSGNRDLAINHNVKLDKDVTVTVYNLHGIGFWGNTNGHTLDLSLYNCNDVCEVYVNGSNGTNNIALYNCSYNIDTLVGDTGVYSNANGSVIIDGCTFNGIPCPVNLNHKVAGVQNVTVTNSVFTDCATEGTAAYYAPIRLYNSAEGASQTLEVKGNTFAYSEGKAPINGADVLLNKDHNGAAAVGNVTAEVQVDAKVFCGSLVDLAYTVSDKDDLAYFASEVNKGAEYEGNTYEGKTVVLTADIDLGGAEWAPIGSFGSTSKQFKGTFDGREHTVSNFKITQKAADREGKNRSSQGFFGNVNGTVKNLTVANATVNISDDGRFVGGIIGRLNGGLVENCHLADSLVEGSAWQIGGIVGQVNAGLISDCTVVNTTVTGKAGVGAIAGFQMEAKETTIEDCAVENCAITQKGSYGEGYDDMFAAILGCVNNSGATVNVNNCTVENTTVKGEASTAALGYIEDGAKVYLDGYEVIADGLSKNGTAYRVYNANGLEALNGKMADKSAGKNAKVELMADIDYTGKVWTPVDSHADTNFYVNEINGNGYTVSNLTVNGQAMFKRFAGSGNVIIKDLTFDNATVNSTAINTSILTVQSYQNVLLDNVDVKNSSITGSYKVAPLLATVYNEGSSTVTATLKDCDVSDTTVTSVTYNFCVAGMVAFVYEDDNDKIEFENCTVTNVKLVAPDDSYDAYAAVYTAGSENLYNEAEGVTVTNVTYEAK